MAGTAWRDASVTSNSRRVLKSGSGARTKLDRPRRYNPEKAAELLRHLLTHPHPGLKPMLRRARQTDTAAHPCAAMLDVFDPGETGAGSINPGSASGDA